MKGIRPAVSAPGAGGARRRWLRPDPPDHRPGVGQ